MKPAKFDYYAPTTRDEAFWNWLGQHGYDAKVLAGGQSLMPMMNLRLARPGRGGGHQPGGGPVQYRQSTTAGMTIGSMTRQRQIERSG